jgi:arylsulfatase A-like enzyme
MTGPLADPFHFMQIMRLQFMRTAALAAAILFSFQLSPRAATPPQKERKPNIIFILADDLGYGDLGCYGQKRIKTPNLDQMAAEGARFTQFYAGSTVCAPSRASLMTGLHTGHTRIRGNGTVPLAPEDLTVAELLKQAGYSTGAVGKWGLGLENTTGEPNRKGFDEWFGFLDQTHAHNYYPDFLWRNGAKFRIEKNFDDQQGEYVQDFFIKASGNLIRINQYKPFFLYLAYTIPHANNELKNEGMQIPSDAPYTQESWPQQEKNKAAMITRLDEDVGIIMGLLKKYKIDTNTVVFFTSDNGPHKEGGVNPAFFQSSGPLRGIKRDLYEGGIRVPMIVRWPGVVKGGMVSDQPWAFWDILPTAATIAGITPPEKTDGISMLPAIVGNKQENHPNFYWEFHEGGFKQAVRMKDWKAVRPAKDKPWELYDLTKDISESHNLADQNPDLVAKIQEYVKTARTDSPHWPVR